MGAERSSGMLIEDGIRHQGQGQLDFGSMNGEFMELEGNLPSETKEDSVRKKSKILRIASKVIRNRIKRETQVKLRENVKEVAPQNEVEDLWEGVSEVHKPNTTNNSFSFTKLHEEPLLADEEVSYNPDLKEYGKSFEAASAIKAKLSLMSKKVLPKKGRLNAQDSDEDIEDLWEHKTKEDPIPFKVKKTERKTRAQRNKEKRAALERKGLKLEKENKRNIQEALNVRKLLKNMKESPAPRKSTKSRVKLRTVTTNFLRKFRQDPSSLPKRFLEMNSSHTSLDVLKKFLDDRKLLDTKHTATKKKRKLPKRKIVENYASRNFERETPGMQFED